MACTTAEQGQVDRNKLQYSSWNWLQRRVNTTQKFIENRQSKLQSFNMFTSPKHHFMWLQASASAKTRQPRVETNGAQDAQLFGNICRSSTGWPPAVLHAQGLGPILYDTWTLHYKCVCHAMQ